MSLIARISRHFEESARSHLIGSGKMAVAGEALRMEHNLQRPQRINAARDLNHLLRAFGIERIACAYHRDTFHCSRPPKFIAELLLRANPNSGMR